MLCTPYDSFLYPYTPGVDIRQLPMLCLPMPPSFLLPVLYEHSLPCLSIIHNMLRTMLDIRTHVSCICSPRSRYAFKYRLGP